ncbi:MAG: hypothetical protein FJ095_06000 [Deltaproteobacteria bacterium]|nr:hypothetical protein [Deltaproteobacteria bacterium]
MSPRPHSRKSFKSTLAAALLAAAAVTVVPARSFAQEEQAQSLYDDAMDNDYLNTKFDDAAAKLNKAVKQCGKKCNKQLLGKLYVALAVVNGAGKGGTKAAKAAFEKAFKADKNAKPLDLYFTDELRKLFEAAKKSAGGGADEEAEASPKKPAGAEEASSESTETEDAPKKKKKKKKKPAEATEEASEPAAEATEEEAPPKKPKSDEESEDAASASGSVDWKAPSEAQVNTPLPIFIPVDEGLGAVSAKLRYKPFGETKWLALGMRKVEGGFGAEIPCAQTTTTGKLKLYIFLKDKDGEPVAQAGSAKAPLEVSIKNKISGDQPALPGEKAPEKCSSVECPPDFPGCKGSKSGAERDGKGWGATCENTAECKSGFVCLNGSCEQGESSGSSSDGGSTAGETKRDSGAAGPPLANHLVTAGLQLDVLFLASANDVCGSYDGSTFTAPLENFSCFLPNDGGEFIGRPFKGAANQVLGGGAVGGARLLVGYDFNFGTVSDSLHGFVAGARLGYAFGGSPSIGDVEERYQKCQEDPSCAFRKPSALDFLPAHAELQLKWFPLESLSSAGSLYEPRPYVFSGFGVGQVNAGVSIDVCDLAQSGGLPATAPGPCNGVTAPHERRQVDAYQITGLNFVPVGLGAIFPVHENFGINVEVKAMFMVPTAGTVLAPFIGPVGMF